MSTVVAKPNMIEREWVLICAEGKTLGRLASEVARLLMGKHKPIFTKHIDTGDYVVVINCSKLNVTGDKLKQKKYYTHTGRPGSLKTYILEDKLDSNPQEVLLLAVKGMLPKGPLGRQYLSKLKLYADANHKHQAQLINQPSEDQHAK